MKDGFRVTVERFADGEVACSFTGTDAESSDQSIGRLLGDIVRGLEAYGDLHSPYDVIAEFCRSAGWMVMDADGNSLVRDIGDAIARWDTSDDLEECVGVVVNPIAMSDAGDGSEDRAKRIQKWAEQLNQRAAKVLAQINRPAQEGT